MLYYWQALLLLAVVSAVVVADNSPPPPPPPPPYSPPAPAPAPYKPQPSYPEAEYSFEWQVKDDYSGNDYGQQEQRQGKNAEGSYYVALPDGRLQKVAYRVDGYGGFVADVTFEGEAKYEEAAPSYPRPSYQPAPPAPEPKYQPEPKPEPPKVRLAPNRRLLSF